jgi:hypothetical protein
VKKAVMRVRVSTQIRTAGLINTLKGWHMVPSRESPKLRHFREGICGASLKFCWTFRLGS